MRAMGCFAAGLRSGAGHDPVRPETYGSEDKRKGFAFGVRFTSLTYRGVETTPPYIRSRCLIAQNSACKLYISIYFM